VDTKLQDYIQSLLILYMIDVFFLSSSNFYITNLCICKECFQVVSFDYCYRYIIYKCIFYIQILTNLINLCIKAT
jgi:hypothetical protein